MTSDFNFFQHWYPVIPLEDIDPNYPTPVTLLGLRLVIWKPKSSAHYQVFLDQCLHRLAPLSEGRIDEKSDNLICNYHGWEFDKNGVCTRIPQKWGLVLGGLVIISLGFYSLLKWWLETRFYFLDYVHADKK